LPPLLPIEPVGVPVGPQAVSSKASIARKEKSVTKGRWLFLSIESSFGKSMLQEKGRLQLQAIGINVLFGKGCGPTARADQSALKCKRKNEPLDVL
jgi:hypothetical protein